MFDPLLDRQDTAHDELKCHWAYHPCFEPLIQMKEEGQRCFTAGDFEGFVDANQRAIRLARKSNYKRAEIAARIRIARHSIQFGYFDVATEQLRAAFDSARDDEYDLALEAAQEWWRAISRTYDLETELRVLNETSDWARHLGSETAVKTVTSELASHYRRRGNWEQALELYLKAGPQSPDAIRAEARSHVKRPASDWYVTSFNPWHVIERCSQRSDVINCLKYRTPVEVSPITLSKEFESRLNQASVLANINEQELADLLAQHGFYGEVTTRPPDTISNSFWQLYLENQSQQGVVDLILGHASVALSHFQKVWQNYEHLVDQGLFTRAPELESHYLQNLAMALHEMKCFSQAESVLLQLLANEDAKDDTRGKWTANYWLAETSFAAGDAVKARQYAQESINLSEQLRSSSGRSTDLRQNFTAKTCRMFDVLVVQRSFRGVSVAHLNGKTVPGF